jgi:Uma2 family endonuclease
MPAVLTRPPTQSRRASVPPTPKRWTLAQFHQLGDGGYFEGMRAKLIHGVIIEEGPMNPPHAVAGEKTEEVMRSVFGLGWRMRIEKPLVLGSDTDPMPDLAIVAGRPTVAGGHPTSAALVIEIADTSLDYDTTTKAELYATAGIADYWVLDVDHRQLLVFRDPAPLPAGLGATAYQTRLTLADTDTVAPLALPTAAVRVADLLP